VTKFVTLPVGREKPSSGPGQHRLFRLRPFLKPGRMKAMQLKHLNLTTSDVSGLAAFFERLDRASFCEAIGRVASRDEVAPRKHSARNAGMIDWSICSA
jgi:hypothetical protein